MRRPKGQLRAGRLSVIVINDVSKGIRPEVGPFIVEGVCSLFSPGVSAGQEAELPERIRGITLEWSVLRLLADTFFERRNAWARVMTPSHL